MCVCVCAFMCDRDRVEEWDRGYCAADFASPDTDGNSRSLLVDNDFVELCTIIRSED